jgi:hypothetical protein
VRPEGLGKFKKIHSPHWVSNPRPSGLQHSTLSLHHVGMGIVAIIKEYVLHPFAGLI